MDITKFTTGLEALLKECGMEAFDSPEFTLLRPDSERYIGSGMERDDCAAVRVRQPFEIRVVVKVWHVGDWHHVSGDDRRLHPYFRLSGGE